MLEKLCSRMNKNKQKNSSPGNATLFGNME